MAAPESEEIAPATPKDDLDEGSGSLSDAKPPSTSGSARCMTVEMNNFSLRFEDPQTEHDYHIANARRQRQRWFRALIVSGLFQVIFFAGDEIDALESLRERLVPRITAPVRLVILVMQLSLAVLLWLNLIPASQPWILGGSLAYAVPTLLIFALQKEQMHQWDIMFLIYGLCYFIIPKISPLRFLASSIGSAVILLLYFWLALFVRPSTYLQQAMAAAYCLPLLILCSYVSYSMERASRERFVLHHVLRREHKQRVRFTMTRDKQKGDDERYRMFLGVLPWIFVAVWVGGWLPPVIQEKLTADLQSGRPAIGHVVGFALFLTIVTRKLRYFFLTFVLGTAIVWFATQAVPAEKMNFTAQSVGYVMLSICMILALGVFGRFVFAWRQLLVLVRRVLLMLPPSLRDTVIPNEYPILDSVLATLPAPRRINQELVMSNGRSNSGKMARSDGSNESLELLTMPTVGRKHNKLHKRSVTARRPEPERSPRKSKNSGEIQSSLVMVTPVHTTPLVSTHKSATGKSSNATDDPAAILPATVTSVDGCASPLANTAELTHVSTRWAGRCFFCGDTTAHYAVPVCASWGGWAAWRTEMELAIETEDYSAIEMLKGCPTKPCTPFAEVSLRENTLTSMVSNLEAELKHWKTEAAVLKARCDKLMRM